MLRLSRAAPRHARLQHASGSVRARPATPRQGISIQSWGILPKIRDVDAHLTPVDQSRIREGHPEVSFALMNGGHALTEHKSTRAGREARLTLLELHFPGIRDEMEKAPPLPHRCDRRLRLALDRTPPPRRHRPRPARLARPRLPRSCDADLGLMMAAPLWLRVGLRQLRVEAPALEWNRVEAGAFTAPESGSDS